MGKRVTNLTICYTKWNTAALYFIYTKDQQMSHTKNAVSFYRLISSEITQIKQRGYTHCTLYCKCNDVLLVTLNPT